MAAWLAAGRALGRSSSPAGRLLWARLPPPTLTPRLGSTRPPGMWPPPWRSWPAFPPWLAARGGGHPGLVPARCESPGAVFAAVLKAAGRFRDGGMDAARPVVAQLDPATARRALLLAAGLLAARLDDDDLAALWSFACVSAVPSVPPGRRRVDGLRASEHIAPRWPESADAAGAVSVPVQSAARPAAAGPTPLAGLPGPLPAGVPRPAAAGPAVPAPGAPGRVGTGPASGRRPRAGWPT